MGIILADIWRFLVFGQALFVLILTVLIVIRYSAKMAKVKSSERALPIHIICVSLSYLGLIAFVLIELHNRMGESLTWRMPYALACFSLGDAALIFMIVHLQVQRVLVTAVLDKATELAAKELRRVSAVTDDTNARVKEMQSAPPTPITSKLSQDTEATRHCVEDTREDVKDIKGKLTNGNHKQYE